MNRTRIKICGITNWHDAGIAVAAGADALGFMMYEESPRFVESTTAAEIVRRLPPFVSTVGVFVNASRDQVLETSRHVGFDLLQFHGDESDDFCREFGPGYIKGVRVAEDTDVTSAVAAYPHARAVLLDAHVQGIYGGTGRTFDWHKAVSDPGKPVILAGGLTPANVCQAIRAVRPWAVDVSGGVEKDKGVKDPEKVRAFVNAIRSMGAM